jgi:hypothetical protein
MNSEEVAMERGYVEVVPVDEVVAATRQSDNNSKDRELEELGALGALEAIASLLVV